MPINPKFVRVRASGEVRAREMLSGLEAAIQDPGFRDGMKVLYDGREATPARDLGVQKSLSNALYGGLLNKPIGEVGLLFNESPVMMGLARQGHMAYESRGVRIHIFHDPEEAERWASEESTDP